MRRPGSPLEQATTRRPRLIGPYRNVVLPPPVRVNFDITDTTVSMEPANLFGDNYSIDTLDYMAIRMRNQVRRLIRQKYPRLTPTQQNNVTGQLQMYNDEAQSRSKIEEIPPADITGEAFAGLFDRATAPTSNPDLQIGDMKWLYWINPASVRSGSAPNQKYPNLRGLQYNGKKLAIPQQSPKIDTSKLGCAAIALAIALEKKEKAIVSTGNSYHKSPIFTRHVYSLQHRLNFPTPKKVTILELSKIVELYPEYRLCIIESYFTKPFLYEGKNFDISKAAEKTLHIFYDIKNDHYEPITGIGEFISTLRGEFNQTAQILFCHICCQSYKRNTESSTCGCPADIAKRGVTSKQKIIQCDHCEEKFAANLKSTHKCGENKCKQCQLYWKSGDLVNHRCNLSVPDTLFKRKFAFDDFAQVEVEEKKLFELWAWDIESEFIKVLVFLNR